jgi:DnaJ C terminal domain/Rhomboid family
VEISAFFFLAFWFLLQFINAAGSDGQAGGIAWWAHIGGFLFGMLWLKIFTIIPETGLSGAIRGLTEKKKSNRLQVIRPVVSGDDNNLYGTIHISNHEALFGTQKIVSLSSGFRKKIYKVVVPPGLSEGNILRLKGLGQETKDGPNGDLLLKMAIKP